jgi:hypothetical protein
MEQQKNTGKKIKPKAKKIKKSVTNKKRTGENAYIGKYEHIFNKKWLSSEIMALADELLEWMEEEIKNLWFNDFFITKRISRQRIAEFCKNDYFGKVYDLCKGIQESRMFKAGTSKTVNPAMFIIGLKNNHGWTDKQEVQHSGGVKVIHDDIN